MPKTRLGLLAALVYLHVGCGTSPPPTGDAPHGADPGPPPPHAVPIPDEVEAEHGAGPSNTPVSLTASDGTGLQIVSFAAKAVVEDPLAFTEIHLVFKNPLPRALEGQFSITLPSSATVSRFAMKQAWGWQEGEVVELQAARRAYEDFLHRKQDPALMEKQPGNEFHARVFPIGPSETKEIIVSYSEALTRAGEPYRVNLRGLPLLEQLDVHALVARRAGTGPASSMGGVRMQNEVVEVHKTHFVPDLDFTVAIAPITQQPQAGLRNAELVVARITPVASAAPDLIGAGGLHVLFDTSASRALGFSRSVQKLGEVIGELARTGAATPLTVTAFDQETVTVYEGTLGGFDAKALAKLGARGALGASDLGAALDAVARSAAHARVLLFTDGIATAGSLDAAALASRVKALSGAERIDAIVSGGIRDADRLADLVTAGLPKDGVVIEDNRTAATIAGRLGSATVPRFAIHVPGSTWVWPAEVKGIQPGDQLLVYAALPAEKPLVVDLEGAKAGTNMRYPVATTEVERPLLERASVTARLHKLESERATTQDAEKASAIRKEAVSLSTKYRVLCNETALLVLETDDDYARFQIDRNALSNILTVGDAGIAVESRAFVAKPAQPPRADGESSNEIGARSAKKHGDDLDGLFPAPEKTVGGKAEEADERARADDPSATLGMGMLAPAPAMAPPAPIVGRPPRVEASALRIADGADAHRAFHASGQGSGGGGIATAGLDDITTPTAAAKPEKIDPYTGPLKEIMDLVAAKKLDAAEGKARAWRARDPGDVLALVALGEVWEKRGNAGDAARAYGSIIDLFPGRADLRRFAGERLERVTQGLALAIDTYEKARDQRPDHPNSHRLLAYALVRAGRLADAFTAIRAGAARAYPDNRFRGVDRILKEDVGLIGAAWRKKEPNQQGAVDKALTEAGAALPTAPSLRFVLSWETDANDVDFHIHDGQGGHAYFSQPTLPSGGALYADVTTGYGPECFTIPGKPAAYPYTLQAHYYSRGPMGYGMGKLEIISDDGQGTMRFEERPFVIMVDQAFVDLGRVTGPTR